MKEPVTHLELEFKESGPWLWVLIVAAVFSVAWFLTYANDRSLWLDEAFSANLASKSWQEIVSDLRYEPHPPLYFFALKIWTGLAGPTEKALRAFSGLAFVISIVTVYRLAQSVHRETMTALFSAVLFAASKTAVAQSQHVRMYSFLGCLVALSTFYFTRSFFLRGGRASDYLLYALFTMLGSFTHVWYFFLLFGQFVAYWLFCDRSKSRIYLGLTAVAVLPYLVLWLPILLQYQVSTGAGDWLKSRSFGIGALLGTFADYYGEGILGGLVWAGLVGAIFYPRPSRELLRRVVRHLALRENAMFGVILAVSLLTPLLVSQLRPIYRIGSYTIIGLVPLTIILGSTLSSFASRRISLPLLSCLVAGSLVVFTVLRLQETQQPCSDRKATEYIVQNAAQGDVIVFTSLSRSSIDYYLRRHGHHPQYVRVSFPAELALHPGWQSISSFESRRVDLDIEAEELVNDLATWLGSESRLFLFYGVDRQVSDLLKDRLDQRLEQIGHFSCEGKNLFYDRVIVYSRDGSTDEPTPVAETRVFSDEGWLTRFGFPAGGSGRRGSLDQAIYE